MTEDIVVHSKFLFFNCVEDIDIIIIAKVSMFFKTQHNEYLKKSVFYVLKVDAYGTQQPIALLKILLEKGGLYGRGKELHWKQFKNISTYLFR
jgi:hypothetical protein